MSNDRVTGVAGTTNSGRALATLEGGPAKANQSVLERRAIEAQAGVKRLEQASRVMGFSAPLGSGDDGITMPRTPTTPPPPATNVVPPPAAQPPPGLQTGVDGFPPNSVRTPGGYTIVATGDDAAWDIYGPGSKPPEAPLTHVWGDPHVNEKDGTRWDFTKDSNFALPDGTLIRCDTTSEVGHAVTQGITIVAGNDKVEITGINQNHVKMGAKTQDGEAWMNQNAATLQSGATFLLRSDGNNVDWFRATNGKLEGVVTGSRENFDGKNSYDQVIGGNGQADIRTAAQKHGGMGAGGLGFLQAFDVESFVANVAASLASLVEQDDLKSQLTSSMNRGPVRRAAQ